MACIDMSNKCNKRVLSQTSLQNMLLQEYMSFSLGMYFLLLRHSGVKDIVFRGLCSLALRASDVCSVRCVDERDMSSGIEVECQQWSLTTYMSYLPTHVIEDTMRKNQRGDYAQHDFLNIFVNRLVRLWYESVLRISPALAMRSDLVMLDNVLSKIVVSRAQTVSSIQKEIKSRTGSLVDIEEYVGEWRRHDLHQGLGAMRLSENCILGEYVWVQDANVLISTTVAVLACIQGALFEVLPERIGYCVRYSDLPALGFSLVLGRDALMYEISCIKSTML